MPASPKWHLRGDWFDVCRCKIACSCTFAQAPTDGTCQGVMAWHVREGKYGDVDLAGFNVVAVAEFHGNVWAGEAKVSAAMMLDARANDRQREALGAIFGGKAGGWMGEFAKLIHEVRAVEAAPVTIEVAPDLAWWRAEVPGKVTARGEALTGPTTPPGKRVQSTNMPGSEVGPGAVTTWGMAKADKVNAHGFAWDLPGRSSKHMPFDWTGP